MRLNPEDIDRFSPAQVAAYKLPAEIQDATLKKSYLKFAAKKTGVDDNLTDPNLVSEFLSQQSKPAATKEQPALRASAGPVVRAAQPKPVPTSRFRVMQSQNIAAGSKSPEITNIINPLDQLGVNSVALQMRAMSSSGSGLAQDNPLAADPVTVGSAARKINEGIRDANAYAKMSPAEHAAIEPYLKDTAGGRAFLNRRNAKLASETDRITQALVDPSKPVTTIDQYNAILESADPIVRPLILSQADKLVPETLRLRLNQQQLSEMRDEELLKRNAPLYLAYADDDRLGVTEAQIRSYIANPKTPEAENFFAAYAADESRPKYVVSEDGIRYVEGQKAPADKFRSPYMRFDVTSQHDADLAVKSGASKADVAVARHQFAADDVVKVPTLKGANTLRNSATAVESIVASTQRRIEEGANPDEALDRAMAEAMKSGDVEPGNADAYLAFRRGIVNEVTSRAKLSIASANRRMNAQDAAEIGGFINSFGKFDEFTGAISLTDKVPDLSSPDRINAAARFSQEFDQAGYKTVDEYLIAKVGTDPNGKFAKHIRDIAAMDPAARAAYDPVLSAVMDRIVANKQAGDSYNSVIQQEEEKRAIQRDAEYRQQKDQEYETFRKSYPFTALSRDQFESQTVSLGNGRYRQFANPELKSVYDSADEETRKFIEQSLPTSSNGQIGGASDPATLRAFTAAVSGTYASLVDEPMPIVVRRPDGTVVVKPTSIPMLSDTGVSLMNESITKASEAMRTQLADKNQAKEGTAQFKVSAPKELEDVMASGSGWLELYSRGIAEGNKTGDYRKAQAAYLGARSEKIANRSQALSKFQSDIVSPMQTLAESLGIEVGDEQRSSASALGKLIGQQLEKIMDDGRIDPSEFSVVNGDLFDEALGQMKEARDAAKKELDTLEQLGASGVKITYDSRGNILNIGRADISVMDRQIRDFSELREMTGAVTEAGVITEPEAIPQSMRGEVEKRFANPRAFDPNWRNMAGDEAFWLARDAVYGKLGKSAPSGRTGRGTLDAYWATVGEVMDSAGLERTEAVAVVDREVKAAMASAEQQIKLRIANKLLKSEQKAATKKNAVQRDEAEQKKNRERLLSGVNT